LTRAETLLILLLMLLAIDVGNTNTVLGVFDLAPHRTALRDSFRVQTEKDRTGDEYGLQLKALFDFAGIKMSEVHDVIVSSVVPPMAFPLEQMSKRFFGKKPLFVGPGVRTGMPVLYDNRARWAPIASSTRSPPGRNGRAG